MSFYATMTGEITYPDHESFQAVLNRLENGGWIVDGKFVDETNQPIDDEPCVDKEHKTIRIPLFCHRNLTRVEFFPDSKGKGYVIGTSTDGCFVGWVSEDGTTTDYDLNDWAKENLEPEQSKRPDDSSDELVEWQTMVENEFLADLCP